MKALPDPQVLARVDRLELEARQFVEGYLAGRHRSPRHGFAVEFAQHREYTPGDDIKHIDWKVYGRTERFHLKQYEQETNLVAWLLVDASDSMKYASGALSKYDLACSAAAALGYLVVQQADSLGLATLAGGLRAFLRGAGGTSQLREACRALAEGPYSGPANLGRNLHELAGRTGRRGIVFIFSDLLDDVPDILTGLQHIRYQKHEVVLFHVLHHDELAFDFTGQIKFVGLEVPDELLTQPEDLRARYLAAVAKFTNGLDELCQNNRIERVPVDSSREMAEVLVDYLNQRSLLNRGR